MENISNQQNNGQGFAIASLVIGIFAILFSIIPCVGTSAILIGIVAIVFGTVALTKAQTHDTPKGLSIVGISLGGLAILIATLGLVCVVGSISNIREKFENVFEWAEEFDNIEIDDNDFKDMESLEELENALDELEGVIDSANDETDKVLEDVHKDAKEAIKDAKEEIKDAKKDAKEEIKDSKEEVQGAIKDAKGKVQEATEEL
jgi:ElaB/YqjD/DUF883 family membrane-anchored ribosome-binding protein